MLTQPDHSATTAQHLRAVRIWAALFILGLVLSGITAFPLQHETELLARGSARFGGAQQWPALDFWLSRVAGALSDTDERYPFLAYGTDWLAFGHLVIAFAFVGLFLDPVRNKWLLTFGLVSCAAVIPHALIAGGVRDIPFYWRCIDCSFGVFGCIPLLLCMRHIRCIEAQAHLDPH